MANGRLYNRGERPHNIIRNRGFEKYFYIKVGLVLEVNNLQYTMKIRWLEKGGAPQWMPISFPYAGPGGLIGGLPEEGACVICGYYDEGHGKGAPLVLAYLPSSLAVGLEANNVKASPDQLANDDGNLKAYKFRELVEGDIIVTSTNGGIIQLNSDVEISDSMQDSIVLRDFDQSIISTSVNNFIFADGASTSAGLIIRNNANIFDYQGNRIPNTNARETTLLNGQDIIYLVPFGDRIEYDTRFYCEYRVDVDEIADGTLDSNEINDFTPISDRDPIVTMAMGNYAGSNLNLPTYGQLLRPVIFSSSNDKDGFFDLVQCAQNKGMDEVSTLGLAYALHFLKSGAFIGVDKEGHYYMNLPASSANPLGGGRSMSVLAQGNLKEIWGTAKKDNNSWDLTTKGGIKWSIGSHNSLIGSRSIDIETTGGLRLSVGSEDDDGYAKQETILGNIKEEIGGSIDSNIDGNINLTLTGGKDEDIFGSVSEKIGGDFSINVLGVYSETIVKEKQSKIAARKTTIIKGDDELKILAGNRVETLLAGDKRVTVTAGNSTESIISGNKTISVASGNYNLNIGAGNVSVSNPAGPIAFTGTNITATASSAAIITAPSVSLGTAVQGGVVTGLPGIPSHNDYVTGAPLKGSLTVKASI